MCGLNNRTLENERQKLIELQGEIDESTIKSVFLYPSIVMGTFSRQKISKDIFELKSTMNQLILIVVYGILHPTATYIFFSDLHEIVTR